MVRVKICGVTRVEDALACANAGVDAIGLVFAKSPRRVNIARAREIVAGLPPFVNAIGVFVNERPGEILRTARLVGLSAVQLHGDENVKDVAHLRPLRVIKAIRVRDATFVADIVRFAKAGVGAILLDAYSSDARGGTGEQFDWSAAATALKRLRGRRLPPLILAGGLTPANVAEGIRLLHPWGVDVSGGVENRPGIKSVLKMRSFVKSAREIGKPG
jgi:phosphoribosylanthranilate isomerase